ncbi:MAG: hypothetical protein RLZ47_283 [Bacteroidota bacterium]|jgi:hypothetical protein
MASPKNQSKEQANKDLVFGKKNYQLMLLSILVVALGFVLMIGDTNIYDFRKIVLAPMVVLIGFGIGFFAILKKKA